MRTPSRSGAALLAGLFAALLTTTLFADVVEDFNGGWSDPSYSGISTYNHAGVGIWESNDALVSSSNARSGEAVRFDDGGTSPWLEFQGLDGNGIDGGINTVSFWYRHWDGDSKTVSFDLEYSINGGPWTLAASGSATSTTYQQFSSILNLGNDNIKLRVNSTANGERLLIDDFLITTSGPPGPTIFFNSTTSTGTEPDGTINIPVQLSPAGAGTVDVAVTGGDAGSGTDYNLLTSSLTFTAGASIQNVQISLVDNGLPESNETVVLTLSNATGGTITSGTHTLTITDDDAPPAPLTGTITIMAANTTSGNFQEYQGPGDRIFQALNPDIVGIQEFSVPDAGGHRAWVDRVFGPEFHYMIETGNESIPNGVVSRFPITASGEWQDPQVSNRDFAWATIDIPGEIDLHVVSVHLHGGGGPSSRNIEAGVIVSEVTSTFPASDYIVLCGDLNTTSRTESCVTTLSSIFSTTHVPVDRNGDDDTNQPRNNPYDWVMPNSTLDSLNTTVSVGGLNFPHGIVFDTRLWSPPPSPALNGDSGVSGMQHMAVMKAFDLPLSTTLGTSILWLESHGITSNYDAEELLDHDNDGQLTWQEYLSDTDPFDYSSSLHINAVSGTASTTIQLDTRPDRHYVIQFADTPSPAGDALVWQNFANPSNGEHDETNPSGATHSFIDDYGPNTSGAPPVGGWRLYRVGVSVN